MKRKKTTKEQEEIESYNNELWTKFVKNAEKRLNKLSEEEYRCLNPSLDLIKAINSYRVYKEVDKFLKEFPDLEPQRPSIALLWWNFDNKTGEELSDLMSKMINEVSYK